MSTYIDIEEHFLPKELRIDLCLSILEQAGAEKVKLIEHRGEINHCCVMTWHEENRPSASLNFDRLTYVCKGCGAKGGLYWLIQTVLGGSYDEARDWLTGTSGLGSREFDLPLLLQFLDALENSEERRAPKVMPRYSEKVLEPWERYVYPGLTTGVEDLGITGRGIPEENLRTARVGWDTETNRIVIPLFVHGDLVGWQSRRILDDGSPKYESTPDFPRDTEILGLDRLSRTGRVIVAESPMSYLKHFGHAPVVATYGSDLSPQQVNHLKWFTEVTVACDNDPAGWRSIEGWVGDNGDYHPGWAIDLNSYTHVTAWEHDWFADPADFDEEHFTAVDSARVPVSIWAKPRGTLRCWLCKQPHTGGCR